MSCSNLNLLHLSILATLTSASLVFSSTELKHRRDGWRPLQELDSSNPFVLGGGVPAGYGVPTRNDPGPFNPWDVTLGSDPSKSGAKSTSSLPADDIKPINTTKLNGMDIKQLLLPQNSPPLHLGPLPEEASNWTWACSPMGECEPCPDQIVHYPYCRPYNNRRAVHCIGSPPQGSSLESISLVSQSSKDGIISSLGWESCGKVVRKEAWDYGELVASTLLISLAALLGFAYRQRTLSLRQYEALSRRIGG